MIRTMSMNKTIISIIVSAILISCTEEVISPASPITSPDIELTVGGKLDITDQSVLCQSRIKTERVFQALGTPLVVPLLEESDPGLFLVPTATGDSLAVDALYLADARGPSFDVINNLYPIKCVIYSPNDNEPYRLTVSDKDGRTKTYVIDGWMFRELRRIMNDNYQWPVNIHIALVKM